MWFQNHVDIYIVLDFFYEDTRNKSNKKVNLH